ncbi:hypothetical protein CANARDRAFT_10371 [[Candida] arabinofermentans NRRL YB-2248]|uniref:Ran-specific GTPase-activating protein 30 n=1 Tax=[Candida] arabinofermentans NRRL YB-2248 TaxID=983967 RepID=A0A1E4SSZ3_9ASCO|nr:hypothetical protein CANARDRAFT_10371 [[Candida] arabinofermentans NRRL YB-2248]
MDQFLSKAGSQIVTFAVRSGVQIASSYVIKSVGKLMETVPEKDKLKIERLRNKLQTRIEIVTYAIELIQLVASRGNTNLDSTLRLTKDLKQEIDEFEENIQDLAGDASNSNKLTPESIKIVESSIQGLMQKIDQAIPVINLALTTSGANLHGADQKVQIDPSPGRLLNATVIVNDSNKAFDVKDKKEVQVGPNFETTMYNIFYNPAKAAHGESEITWREKYAKCQLKLIRVPLKDRKYHYVIRIVEDFDDGRYHDEEEDKPEVREIDLSSIIRLFFSASGSLLKLDEKSSPVLVFKVNKAYKISGSDDSSSTTSSPHQIEWIAIGDYDDADEESDSDEDSESDAEEQEEIVELADKSGISLGVKGKKKSSNVFKVNPESQLSLLEYMIRFCVLQATDQISILKVKDERLKMYLTNENPNLQTTEESSLSEKMSKLSVED